MKIAKRLVAIPCYVLIIALTTVGALGILTCGKELTNLVNKKLWY